MASPNRSGLSPTASRLTTIIPNTTVISPRSISTRSQLEESISTLQNEQERVQKKTFTKWVNIYLSLHEPSYYVNDLFEDFRDGTKLIALLEVLSGQNLPVERGKKRAHFLSNADNALKYLESRKIKLVNIRPIDIVDGKPMMTLGLIWMLILCYQIEDSNMFDEDSKDTRSKAKEALLEWVRKKTAGQLEGLDIRDFTSSWRDGLAFNALIHALRPGAIDLHRVIRMDVRERLEHAFNVAEQQLGIPRLIDAEDVDVKKPDEKSIMTYVAQFSRRFPDLPFGSINKEHGELLRWLADTRQRLTLVLEAPIRDIQLEYKEYVKQAREFAEKQKQWKAFERKESKSPHFPGEKLKELKDSFDDIAHRMNRWRHKLDTNLPGELGQIADWINTAETILARGVNFDPLTLTPEDNVQRFTKLNEEHAAIFTDKEVIQTTFQRIKRDQSITNKQIAIEHLTNLSERLDIIMHTSDERGRYLDFEQTHWKVQVYFTQLEYFIQVLDRKQGDLYQTEKLYNEYKRKIHDEKLLAHVESLLPELSRKAQNYSSLGKKDDNVSRNFTTYCDNIRKTIKSLTIDLRSKEHMLQETIENWRIYHNLYETFEKWLIDGEQILRRSSDEKLTYFANLDHWTQIHDKLRLAIEHLISICEDDHVTVLKNKLLYINRRWKEIIESIQQFKHDESVKKKRDEFYAGRAKLLDTLDRIDREMQEYLPCTTRALKEQENRLYDAQAELDMFNQTVQILSKLSQTIARESGEPNASVELNSLLQICFDKLHHIQEYLPLTLKRNKIMLGHLQKFEDGLHKCQQWFNEARLLINRYSVQVPVKRIEDSLEQHRSFFADIGYYQSLLDSKLKLILAMKKANENLVPLNFAPVDEQYKQLADSFEDICQQANYWEKDFSQHSLLWKDFHQRLRHLQDWIDQAQAIVCEKHEDYAYLIQKHKNFFQIIDDEILHGFIKSGRELLHIRDKTDQQEIQTLMDSLETKWNTIVGYAPIRLLHLQYERIENIIVKELKQAEDELNDELRQLERQRDTTDILRRHNEHFQLNNFQPTMDTYMKNLQTFANDIRSKKTDSTYEIEQIDQRTGKLNDYWTRMQTKIDTVKRKLQTIPKKWQEFEEKFHLVETWMSTIERSMTDTQNTEINFDQYKLLVNKFKADVEQIDSIAQDVKTLTNLLDELIDERATDDPTRHRHRLDTLLVRYRQLLKSIDETSQHCSVLIPAKMIHENTSQLTTTLANISNAPIHFRDLNDVRVAVQGQIKVCDVLENLSSQVNELITRGNDLILQPAVPKYVSQDVQNIQKYYHEKVFTAQDFLTNLKRLLDLWECFDANKRRYQQQAERLNNELAQFIAHRSSITSFQHEIDNGKYLRTSYADLKSILDENAQYLQTMSANHLIPYDNLQRLKAEYDLMVEELIEKLRTIDDFLQDLIDDNNRWAHFNDELKRLETVFREIGSMFDANMFGERTLEEKQQILERIRSELGEHLHSLSLLHSDRSNLENLRCRPKDLAQVLGHLSQLNALAESTSGKVNREEEHVVRCRTHVQTTQRFIEQLQPWIEQAENYLSKRLDQNGALNLVEAKQLYEKHKDFLEERRRMSLIYNNIQSEEKNITDQYELKSTIKSLSTRWNEIVRKSDDLTPRYDKQYSSWLVFESELNSFRDQILLELEQRVDSTTSFDTNKLFDLTKIHTLLNELRVLDNHIHTHTSNYNRFYKQLNDLRQYATAEGQRILHEEQMSIETRWHRLTRLTTDKLRELERLYESRKSLHNRFEVFDRNLRDIAEQIDSNAHISTGNFPETLDRLQQIQKQLQTLQPLVSTIGQEFAELELAGLTKAELQTIRTTFDAHRQKIQTYEAILQKRLDLLKRYDSHLKRSADIRTRLQDIHDEIQQKQHMKSTDIDQLKAQVDRYTNDLRTIQNESNQLDRLMEESHTVITDSTTNRNLFFVVESRAIQNLVETIDNKLIQRRIQTEELTRLLDDFSQSHTNLLNRIAALSNNLRSARLLGYSPREIDDLMIIIKTLNREIQNESTQLNVLRGKFKSLASDLSNDDRQKTEQVLNQIELDFNQLQEQIDKRQERLTTLLQQRLQLDQFVNRFHLWLDDKQRLITNEQTIPLKLIEIERIQKKYTETISELKPQRTALDNILNLNDEVKQLYAFENQINYNLQTDEFVRKLNHLEENLLERNRQLTLAIEQRREFEQIQTKLLEWMKTIEEQIKDPFTNELQQPVNILKERLNTFKSLLQTVKDRSKEFEELTRMYQLVGLTLNEADRLSLDEKYSLSKDKYNRLLDNLTQRIALLDEAIHERTEFDDQTVHVQNLYDKLQAEYTKLKQSSSSNEQRLEQYKQLVKHFDETKNQFQELTRLQRLLNSKGYRIDFRFASELNVNLKNFDGVLQTEIERIERALQNENDFYQLDKELETYLNSSAEQLNSSQHHQDRGIIYQTVADRLQQAEHELNKLIHLSERLVNDLPRTQYEQLKRTTDRRQERLQSLMKTCQQARNEHDHIIKTQQKLNEDLISTNDWFRRLILDFAQPLELNLSLNNINDLQDSLNQLTATVNQRIGRIEQLLYDEPNIIHSSDEEIRERLDIVEELKHQVQSHLKKQRHTLEDIHEHMTEYLKITTEIKAAVCDADFKLAPFFDGYDRRRLDEHEKDLNFLQDICTKQSERIVEAHELVEYFRGHLKPSAREICENQLRNFHQSIEDIETRIFQRRKELDEIRQKSVRFNTSLSHLLSDTDRVLHLIEKSPESADNLITEIDSTLSTLQYLGRDLKKSLDATSSTDIDRELKEVAHSVESIRDSLERAKKTQEENDLLCDRIERTLSKIKSFTNRKRQELHETIDSAYGSVDLVRQSVEMKNFIREIDLESSHLNETNELITVLIERKYDLQIVRILEKKHQETIYDLQNLKAETTKTIEQLEYQIQEQDKLRQQTRTMLAILQRTKVQLIELRPTINNETDSKLKKIQDDLTRNFNEFEQSIENYKTNYNVFAEDLDKIINRIYEDIEDIKTRLSDKQSEFNNFNHLKNEFEKIIENLTKFIETKSRSKTNKLNIDSLKELSLEMQNHRASLDRCQLLASNLTSNLSDSNERELIRRRLNEITRRWTELEQNVLTEEEEMTEFQHLNQQYQDVYSTADRWTKQAKDLVVDLTNAKTIENLDQLIPKTRLILSDYQSNFDHLQRLRNRLTRLGRTSETSQKLNEIDRILKDLTSSRDQLEQRLDLGQKMQLQFNEFNRQHEFYNQWIENIHRTIDTIVEENLSIEEKRQRLSTIQTDLDKRKQIIQHFELDYPQISQSIQMLTSKLIGNIDKLKGNLSKKHDEYEQYIRQQKEYQKRIETIFDWIKQTQRYEPISDKRNLEALQREQTKVKDKQQQIQEKSKEIDGLLRTIQSSKLPADSSQKLRHEIDHLKERLGESSTELDTRAKFLKKSIHDLEKYQQKQRSYQESLSKLSSLVENDLQPPGRSIEDALKSLDEQMNKFELESIEREKRRRQHEREWHLLHDELNLLQEKLNSLKQRKYNVNYSIEEQLQFIQNQNQELNQYQEELSHLKQHGQQLCIEGGNSIPLPSEFNLVQSMITAVQEQLEQQYGRLVESMNYRDVYLNECKLFEDAYNHSMDRLSRPFPLVSTPEEYARQLAELKISRDQIDEKHRHINYLYDKLDRDTCRHYSRQYNDFEKRANDLQSKYLEQIIHSEYILRTWKEYEIRLEDLHRQIIGIDKQSNDNQYLIPFQQIQTIFHLYKDFKQRLIVIESDLFHLNDEIQNLCKELNILPLQTNLLAIKENFIQLNNEIQEKFNGHKNATILANDIKRNQAILDETLGQCSNEIPTRYDADSNQLKIQLERLMDVEKRLDNLVDVYSSSKALLQRLSTSNVYDLQSIENNLENFHHQWTNLKTEIARHENLIHENLINNLPTRQACKEIFVFIDTIKRLLDEDNGAPITDKEALQKLLKRYRDMRVDVLNHQRIIDFLNESLQRETNADATSFDYMENIKQINIDWIRIKSLISARIDILERLNDQFNEFDQTIRTLSDWVHEQTSDLEFMKNRAFESGVKDNLRKCNELEYQLNTKQQILTSLKSFNGRLISSTSTFRLIDQDGAIQHVRHMLEQLSPSIEQLKQTSKTILNDWHEYNRVLIQMDKILRESEAELDRIQTSAITVETYEMSTKKAQEYLQAMESRRFDFEQINAHNRQLSGQCDSQLSSKINEITIRIQQQWTIVLQRLQDTVKSSKDIIDNWREFNSSYVLLLDRLGELENRWYAIQQDKFTVDIDSLFDKAKDFEQRLQQLDSEVVKLENHSKKLCQSLPSISAKKIDTQYSVITNQYSQLQNFQIKLLTECNELKHREKIYLEYFNELSEVIVQVQARLKTDENNPKQLNELDKLLQNKYQLVERLNSNEFIYFVKRGKHLHDLILEYSNVVEQVKGHLKQIELNEFNKLNFDKQCQKWNEYIHAIERNLAVIDENIQTNYHGLVEIDRNLSNTIQDFNQRQYELIQLITKGKEIVENRNVFIKLEQRWQNTKNAILKKQQQVKEFIQIWVSYQNYLESYYRLLKGKCEIEQQELHSPPINQIKQTLSQPITSQTEEMKILLDKIYQTNRQLIKHSDIKTQMILEKEWNDLQKSVREIDSNLKHKSDALVTSRNSPRKEKLLLRYSELDRTLDELGSIVKSIRSLQQQSTDDLDQFVILCQNKNRELAQYRTELQRVRQAITEISPELHSDDSRQLIQKLNLLEIQWTDAERILSNLIDGLTRRRSDYQEFEHRFLRFIQWFEHFLNNDLNQRLDGLTLSASLDILKHDIRQVVDEKRRQVTELLVQARLLQSQTTDPVQLQNVKTKIEQLEQIIHTSEQHVDNRIKKTELVLKMLNDFDEGYENLRVWLDTIEASLQRPLITENSNEIHAHRQSLASIELDIEKHTSIITSLLALGHNLLTENETRPRNIETVARSVQTLEERWVLLKDLLRKRKLDLNDIHASWRNVDEMLKRALKMIGDHDRFLVEVKRNNAEGLQGIRNECKSLENFKRTLDNDAKVIQQITNSYSEVLRIYPTADTNGEMKTRIRELNLRWDTLNATFNESLKNLKYMLSVHGDFQLTQDSLSVWLTDLDVILTNLEHLSDASTTEKIRQLDDMDREIQEKHAKIEYVQTCANYLVTKTVDARGLTLNMSELSKFCQQLRNLTKRIQKLKQNLLGTNDVRMDTTVRSRSPSRKRHLRRYENIEFGKVRQRADQLFADFEDLILQINGDFRSKDDNFQSPTPVGVQIDSLPVDFTYNRVLLSTRRKIEALRDLIQQINQELASFPIQDLSNDSAVIDIMTKWSHLQTLAIEKDEQLKQNRQLWSDFKRQLDDLERAAKQFTNLDQFLSRTNSSKSDVHQRLDEFQVLLKSTIESADEFCDSSNEWMLVEHRLRLIKDRFQFLLTKTNRSQREYQTDLDVQTGLVEINTQLDHLESLTQSLEPIDDKERNPSINRTKLHRFIRIHDDLEIVNERLVHINDRIATYSSNDQMRITNDLRLIFDRMNSIKRVVRIHLDQLEKLLAKYESY